MMERQRHTREILHPMYEIIDNALSAGVDGYKVLNIIKMAGYIFLFLLQLVLYPERSQEQQNW